MRLIRRLLVLTLVGAAGVAAYSYWSDNALLRGKAAELATEAAKRKAGELASETTDKLGDRVADARLTAKIKSKMALDDHVKARAIDVDTSDGVATLSGVVASGDERKRALQLARDTEGIRRVIDELEVRKP